MAHENPTKQKAAKGQADGHHHFLSSSLLPTASPSGSAHENALHTAMIITTLQLNLSPMLLEKQTDKNQRLPLLTNRAQTPEETVSSQHIQLCVTPFILSHWKVLEGKKESCSFFDKQVLLQVP